MRRFSNLVLPLVLLLVFVLAGWFGGAGNRVDVAAVQDLMDVRNASPRLTEIVVIVTWLGSAYATIGFAALVAIGLALGRRQQAALLLVITVAAERFAMDELKLLVGRARPAFDPHPVPVSSFSFPSGHSSNSMAAFLAIAIIAAPARFRAPAVWTALAIVLLVGASRVYLGVHWPTDVIGGWCLGLMAVWVAVRVGERSGALEPQHEIVGGHRPALGEDQTE